ncbi:MAG: hypothetical protein HQK60_11545 [Deltaproteobacteria bacterium]|nr:hypothetical protein [Deltaproteobacteria bacterium]
MNRIVRYFSLLALCLVVLAGSTPALSQTIAVTITSVGPSNDANGSIAKLVQPGSTIHLYVGFTVTSGSGESMTVIKVTDPNGQNVAIQSTPGPVYVGAWRFDTMVVVPSGMAPGTYTMTGTVKQGTQVLAESTNNFYVQGGTGHLSLTKIEVSLTKDGPAVSTCNPGDTVFWRIHYSEAQVASGDQEWVAIYAVGPDGAYISGLSTTQTFDAGAGSWVVTAPKTIPATAQVGVYSLWSLIALSGSVTDTQACLGQFQVVSKGQQKPLMNITKAAPPKSLPDTGWQDLGLYGGQINTIAIEPTQGNLVFTGTWNGDGLFKSFDGGQSWQTVPGFRNKIMQKVMFFSHDPSVIWALGYRDIFRSTDGGKSFAQYVPNTGLAYYSLGVHPTDPNVAYVGTAGVNDAFDAGFVLKTSDGGNNWTKLSQQFDHLVTSLAINPKNPSEIWAGTGHINLTDGAGALYKSTNGGASWSQVTVGYISSFENLAIRPDNPLVVFTGGHNGLFRTNDGGATWKKLAPPTAFRGLTLDPSNPNVVYVGGAEVGKQAVFRSTDGGENWVETPLNDLSLSPFTLACHPRYPNIVYLGDLKGGVYLSRDSGKTFTPSSTGIKANVTSFLAKDLTPAGDLLVATISGLYRRGQDRSWQNLIKKDIAYSLLQDPLTPNTIYLGCDVSFVYKSTDNGANWTQTAVTTGDEDNLVSTLAMPAGGGGIIYSGLRYYAGDKGMVSKSLDAGSTWGAIFVPTVPVNTVVVSPDNPNLLLAGTGCFYTPGYPGNLFASPDRGRTWINQLKSVTVNRLTFSPDSPRRIFAACGYSAGTYSGLFVSDDLGTSWTQKTGGLPTAAMVKCEVDPATDALYLATYRYGVYYSPDAGQNWSPLGLDDYNLLDLLLLSGGMAMDRSSTIRADSSAPPNLFVGGENGVSRKSGGGVGWIIGVVRDTDNNLLDNMFVETSGSLDVTFGGGLYRLAVADGGYRVKCFGPGHQTMAFPNKVDVPTAEEVTVNFTLTPSQAAVAFRAVNEYYQPGDHPKVTINFYGQGNASEYLAVFPPDISGRLFCMDSQGNPGGDNLPLVRKQVTLTPDYTGSDTLELNLPGSGRYTLYTVITRPGANVADFSTWLGYDQATFTIE